MRSYRDPKATWFGSPNFTPGRDGHDMTQPSWIVLHTMVGTVQGANARFQQSSEEASATYGIGLDGRLYQWVDEADAAWANGATGQGGKGDNLDSISIEHEDDGDFDGPRTPALYAASAQLVYEIANRYGVPLDRDHVIGHRECDFAQTSCPDGLDVDGILRAAQALASPAPAPAPPAPPAVPDDPGTFQEARPVFTAFYTNQLHLLYVDAAGNLMHRWFPSGTLQTNVEKLATGLVPGALLSGTQAFGQLHVFGPRPDGKITYLLGWGTQWTATVVG